MSSVVIAGNTSGSVTLSAPDVAGTTTLTLPSTSGTVAISSSGTASSSTFLRGDGAWATPTSGGMTLLGTITTTSGNSVSLGSLDLTSYKYIYVVSVGISSNTASSIAYISASNSQSIGAILGFSSTTSYLSYGAHMFDLTSGINLQQGYTYVANSSTYDSARTDITTATTTIYLRLNGTVTFDAGSVTIYGGK